MESWVRSGCRSSSFASPPSPAGLPPRTLSAVARTCAQSPTSSRKSRTFRRSTQDGQNRNRSIVARQKDELLSLGHVNVFASRQRGRRQRQSGHFRRRNRNTGPISTPSSRWHSRSFGRSAHLFAIRSTGRTLPTMLDLRVVADDQSAPGGREAIDRTPIRLRDLDMFLGLRPARRKERSPQDSGC